MLVSGSSITLRQLLALPRDRGPCSFLLVLHCRTSFSPEQDIKVLNVEEMIEAKVWSEGGTSTWHFGPRRVAHRGGDHGGGDHRGGVLTGLDGKSAGGTSRRRTDQTSSDPKPLPHQVNSKQTNTTRTSFPRLQSS